MRTSNLVIALACMASATAVQAGIVIKSSGPSAGQFSVGMEIDDNAVVELDEGDILTVVTARGTRVLRGPGPKRISSNAASRRSTFAVFTRQRSALATKGGLVRSASGGIVANPSLWNVDVTQGGTQCVASTEFLTAWRPEVTREEAYILGIAGSDFHVHVTFEEKYGESMVPGGAMPLIDGRTYTVSAPDGSPAQTFKLAVIEDVPEDMPGMASALLAKGCERQLGLLAEKVMVEE